MPRVLAILPGFMPSTLMCVVRPFLGLQQAQHIRLRVALEAYFDVAALQSVDLVVFCRNVEPRYAYILDAVLAHQVPYVYDIDDNLYEVPASIADGQYYRAPERTALLSRYLQSADLVRVYSSALLGKILPLNECTRQVSTVLDWRLIRQRRASQGEKIKIVYTTSRRNDHLFPIFTPALQQILHDYTGRVDQIHLDGKLTDDSSLRLRFGRGFCGGQIRQQLPFHGKTPTSGNRTRSKEKEHMG